MKRSTMLDATVEKTCSCVLSVPNTWSNEKLLWCGTTVRLSLWICTTSDSVDWENRGWERSCDVRGRTRSAVFDWHVCEKEVCGNRDNVSSIISDWYSPTCTCAVSLFDVFVLVGVQGAIVYKMKLLLVIYTWKGVVLVDGVIKREENRKPNRWIWQYSHTMKKRRKEKRCWSTCKEGGDDDQVFLYRGESVYASVWCDDVFDADQMKPRVYLHKIKCYTLPKAMVPFTHPKDMYRTERNGKGGVR